MLTIEYYIIHLPRTILMIQLLPLLVIFALIVYTYAQETVPDIAPAASPGLKYYIFSQQCYDTFFTRNQWFDVECLKKTVMKMLGYTIVYGSSIVKVPQIIKIVQSKSTFGISFASIVLQSLTKLSAVAYNINRGNPFSVYGQTLIINVQCLIVLFLFIVYADKEQVKSRIIYTLTLIFAVGCLYSALNPEYFPSYFIENAMIAKIFLFCGSRILQIAKIHKVKSTGSLSEITCSLVVLGNFTRLGTAFVEVADDIIYRWSVLCAMMLNGYILLSFLIFKPKAQEQAKQQ